MALPKPPFLDDPVTEGVSEQEAMEAGDLIVMDDSQSILVNSKPQIIFKCFTLHIDGVKQFSLDAVVDVSNVPQEYMSTVINCLPQGINLYSRSELYDNEFGKAQTEHHDEATRQREEYDARPWYKKLFSFPPPHYTPFMEYEDWKEKQDD